MQRVFDLAAAAAGLVILSPLFAVIGLAIKIEDGGQVFYSQFRVGKDFRKFRLYKFRSMVPQPDQLDHFNQLSSLTSSGDPRITRVGKFLRRHKLDELPQLVNIIQGDMQLVGARPEVERYVNAFRAEYALILRDRPGITDPASLAFRHEDQALGKNDVELRYCSDVLPRKLELSLEYSERRGFWSDLAVIIRTVLGADGPVGSSQSLGNTPEQS